MNNLAEAIFEVVDAHPEGVPTDTIGHTLRLTAQRMGDAIEYLREDDAIYGFAGVWLTPRHYDAWLDRIKVVTDAAHAANPMAEGHPGPELLRQAGLEWAPKPLDRLTEALLSTEFWLGTAESVRSPEFKLTLTPRQQELVARVVPHFPDDALMTPSAGDLIDLIPAPIQAVEEIMRLAVIAGVFREIAPGVWYTPKQLEILYDRLCRWAEDRGSFSIAEFRQDAGLTRKYADALLFFYRKKGALVQDGSELCLP